MGVERDTKTGKLTHVYGDAGNRDPCPDCKGTGIDPSSSKLRHRYTTGARTNFRPASCVEA